MKEGHHAEGGLMPNLHQAFKAIFRPFLMMLRERKNRAKPGLGVFALIGLSVLLPVLGWVQLKMLPLIISRNFK